MAQITTSYDVNSGDDSTLAVPVTATQTDGIIISPINRNGTDEAWETLTGCVVEVSQEIEGEKRLEYWGIGGGTVNADFSVTLTAADITRNIPRDGSTLTGTGTGQKFNVGARIRLINFHYNFNKKASVDRANSWSAAQTIANTVKWLFGSANNWIRGDGNDLKFKDANNAETTLSQLTSLSGSDHKVYVSANDTTTGFLNGKLVAGTNISLTENNDGGNETLTIAAFPDFITTPAGTQLTIASGAVTPTRFPHAIESEGAATQDDLVTINNPTAGRIIALYMFDSSHIINLKNGDGNLSIPGGDFTLADPNQLVMFRATGSVWRWLGAAPVPVGTVNVWGTNTAPTGYLLCYGQAISRSTYSNLFDLVGTTFGVGDGSTTFNLPDFRGRLPLGQDDMGGSAANRVTATEADTVGSANGAETTNVSHTHTLSHGAQTSNSGGLNVADRDAGTGGMSANSSPNVMNPYITMNYIIKY
jgi:microcystin-dependent protein